MCKICCNLPRTPPASISSPVHGLNFDRRAVLRFTAGLAVTGLQGALSPCSHAVQGSIAGRIPGLTEVPDEDGFLTYKRPAGKSGGHGVGWSEIPQYSFKVPTGWEEIPVSIADLGGTEIDLRFGNDGEGSLEVVVAPVLRFVDVGFNADVRLTDIGSPDKIIEGFAPELYGAPLEDGDILDTQVTIKDDIPYYSWELVGHRLVAATAVGNRVFLLSISAKNRQWRKSATKLKKMILSFHV
eukprot:g609.t1